MKVLFIMSRNYCQLRAKSAIGRQVLSGYIMER